jgi:hypothetical protein
MMFLHEASLSLPQVVPKLLPEDAENTKIYGTKQSSWLRFYAVLFRCLEGLYCLHLWSQAAQGQI